MKSHHQVQLPDYHATLIYTKWINDPQIPFVTTIATTPTYGKAVFDLFTLTFN